MFKKIKWKRAKKDAEKRLAEIISFCEACGDDPRAQLQRELFRFNIIFGEPRDETIKEYEENAKKLGGAFPSEVSEMITDKLRKIVKQFTANENSYKGAKMNEKNTDVI